MKTISFIIIFIFIFIIIATSLTATLTVTLTVTALLTATTTTTVAKVFQLGIKIEIWLHTGICRCPCSPVGMIFSRHRSSAAILLR